MSTDDLVERFRSMSRLEVTSLEDDYLTSKRLIKRVGTVLGYTVVHGMQHSVGIHFLPEGLENPLKIPANFYVTSTGKTHYEAFRTFLDSLQHNRSVAQVVYLLKKHRQIPSTRVLQMIHSGGSVFMRPDKGGLLEDVTSRLYSVLQQI